MTSNIESKLERNIRNFIAERKRKEKAFRSDPASLAAEIAYLIRHDDPKLRNEKASESDSSGERHWYQRDWGAVRLDTEARFGFISATAPDHFGARKNIITVECPTTGCVAGWAATLAGYPMVLRTYESSVNDFLRQESGFDSDYFNDESSEVRTVSDCWNPETKEIEPVVHRGRELLDLTGHVSAWLFDSDRTMDEVLWALDIIASGKILNRETIDREQYDEDDE